MKVLPIQQYNYSKTNKNTQFKGAKLHSAMAETAIPENLNEWKTALRRLTNAVGEESGLKIKVPDLFKGLKKSCFSDMDFTLYMRDNLMNKSSGTVTVLAEDSTGPLITAAKTADKQFVEFNCSGRVARFGLTEPMEDELRHLFFQNPDVYIDYHDTFGKPAGGMRKYQDAFSDAKFYDREGNRVFGTGLRGLLNAIFG